jgi:hypothetical protein
MSWPNKVYSQSMVPKYTTYNDTNMLFRYSGVKRDGKYLDASGNGNASTSTVGVNADKLKGISLSQRYATVISPILGTTLNPTTQDNSFGAFVRPQIEAGFLTTLFGKGNILAWSQYAAGGVLVYDIGSMGVSWFNGAAYINISTPVSEIQKYHALYVLNNTNSTAYFYVNSVLIGSVNPLVFGPTVAETAQPYRVGYNGSTSAASVSAIGSVKDATLWSRALVAADVRKEWLQYAPMVQLKTGWGAKVSIANESTVGNFVGNGSTPFEILSGTWKTSVQTVDGELHKVVECVAAGTVWLDRKFMNINSTEASYGSWRLSYGHAKDTVNVAHIGLTSTSKAAWDAASNTGYVLRLSATAAGDKLLRYSGGGAANLCFNMPNSSATTNQVQITRRFDNVWQGYQTPYIVAANALLTPPWAPSADGPFTDATYTTSAGMSFTFNPGDWVSLGTVRDTYALTKFLGEFDPREV